MRNRADLQVEILWSSERQLDVDSGTPDAAALVCVRLEANETVALAEHNLRPRIVENRLLGPVEGAFTEIDGLTSERGDRYPIRLTVRFCKATSNGVVSEEDMADIARQIQRVYEQADYVGSLVLDGPSGRPTEYSGQHAQPPHWWRVFWERHFQNTGSDS